jgi:hypothetical protein
MLLDFYRALRPLEAITDAGTDPVPFHRKKRIIEVEESSASVGSTLPLFPYQNLQRCLVCRPDQTSG